MFFGPKIKTVSPREVQIGLEQKAITLIDVREVNENRAARIDGSVLMPLSRFNPAELKKYEGKPIIVYCQSGMRSGQAAKICVNAGLDVANMQGGIMGWHANGLPIKTGA